MHVCACMRVCVTMTRQTENDLTFLLSYMSGVWYTCVVYTESLCIMLCEVFEFLPCHNAKNGESFLTNFLFLFTLYTKQYQPKLSLWS